MTLLASPAVESPLVSVLIRSMDRPELNDALDSLASQSWPAIEIVVVNAKGAGHRPLPGACGPHLLRFVDSPTQLPRSRAANVALAAAAGEFLLFLDDDDLLLPGHIARLADALVRHPAMIAAYAGVELRDQDGSLLKVMDDDWEPDRLRGMNYLPIHAVLFRAGKAARQWAFDESLELMEDWDFWLQLSSAGEFLHVPGCSAIYRLDAGTSGLSGQRNMEKVRLSHAQVLAKWLPHFGLEGWSASLFWYDTAVQHYRKEAESARADAEAARRESAAASLEAQQQRYRAECAEAALAEMHASHSWRLTAPLRRLTTTLKDLKAKVSKS